MGEHSQAQQLGAIVHDDGVVFRLWAPFASSVHVMGSFNDWNRSATPLDHGEDGMWSVDVSGVKPGQEYKYIIKNGQDEFERNDPRALQLTAAQDATVIVDPHFDWGDEGFKMPAPEQQVIYELHVGTFNRLDPGTPGTFATAAQKLDYLAQLGVNVIELLPINGTNMERWWGYEPTYLYAVEASYGGRQSFLEFVKAAHARRIGVVVDVVYNHMSPQNLDLWQFDGWHQNDKGGIYFYQDWRGDTPWGPRLDYGRPEVRQFVSDNVRMWLRDCHVDGIRVDATFAIRNARGRNNDPEGDIADGWKLMQEITDTIKQKPGAMAIAEDMAINEWITKPTDVGGAGFMSQWESSLPEVLRGTLEAINDSDRHLEPVRRALEKSYNGDAFGRVIFSESHDADANGHARLNAEIDPAEADNLWARRRSSLAACLIFTAPGIPMIFQGQEFLQSGWFNHWQALDWQRSQEFKGIVQLYRDLIALRRDLQNTTGGLQGQGFAVTACDEQTKVLAYHRWNTGGPKDDCVVVLNFSNQSLSNHELSFPRSGVWQVRFNSDWQGYSPDFTDTQIAEVQVRHKTGGVNLGPYSALILSQG
jgi:1,4-alpha-glucan branching enzyme